MILGILQMPGVAHAAADGKRIYRRLCADCHGNKGEGVKGKYDDALHGDWSLEKLVRYIDKSMPEGAPEKCVGKDAEAVSRYIYDAFYSREARERNKPARVELARLTNKQYANVIADILLSVSGDTSSKTNAQPGLEVRYFASRDFRQEKRILERLDPGIDFDFLAQSPQGGPLGTNELSARWRGSILAEESGDYEFILSSANGARVWVNNNDEPLIDAWVASGPGLTEYPAVIRLIGGRRYPIRVDFFRSKDPKAAIRLEWKPPHGVREVIGTRHLSSASTPEQFVISTKFPPDDHSVGYERGVSISKEWDAAATTAAIETTTHVLERLDRYSNSKPSDSNRVAKVQEFLSRFAETAFRRPFAKDQRDRFITSRFADGVTEESAVKQSLLMILKSPQFLYVGLPAMHASSHHTSAERLAFGLWDSIPDGELMKAAQAGHLGTREEVSGQARRMLTDPRARAKMRQFLHHWLQMNHVEDHTKDAKLYPGFSPRIVADLRSSLDIFLDQVIWSPESDWRKLLTADYLYMNDRLAKFYGVEAPQGSEFAKVAFESDRRSGVVTHPYLLSGFAYQKATSPIHRGVFLTRNIIGRALKPPPIAVAFNDADFAPNLTMREKVAELTRPQACQTCHSVINPLGFSLEHFDAVGKFRTREGEQLIDAVSEYVTDDGRAVKLAGGRDVATFAIQSEHAQRGFVEQLFHAIVKQPALAYGPNTLNKLRKSFVDSHFNVQKLAVDIVTLAASHPSRN